MALHHRRGYIVDDKRFQPPKDGWLPEGKSEEDVYKLKHLKSVVVTGLSMMQPHAESGERHSWHRFLGLTFQRQMFLSNGPQMQWRAEGEPLGTLCRHQRTFSC